MRRPLSYSEEQRSFAKNVVETLHRSSTNLAGVTMWGAAILGAFIISRRWRDLRPERRSDWLLCGAFVVGSFLSIVMTGPVYPHYFIQLVPGLSMFAAAAFIPPGKAFGLSKADWAKFVFGTVLIVLVIFRTAAAEWSALAQRFWGGEPLSYGIEYDFADYIRSQRTEDFSLFMMEIISFTGYWVDTLRHGWQLIPQRLASRSLGNLLSPIATRQKMRFETFFGENRPLLSGGRTWGILTQLRLASCSRSWRTLMC